MGDAGFLVKWYVKKLYMVKTASLCVQSKRVSRKEGWGEEFRRVQRADQQGGEPIRRRRILWETAQAWNGGVAE